MSWSVVAPSDRAADLAQDLYLLWPGEVAGAAGADGADPALLRQLGPLGFRVKEHGRLPVSARRRSDVGAGVEPRAVGDAPFVTFVGADGKTIWYDLQTPRGEDFWLAGYEIATGKRTWYHLQRDEWSVHFNIAPDGRSFLGDGGDPEMVAHAKDGKWLYLFHPEPVANAAGLS